MMADRYISAEKLKAHYSWWGNDNEYKKIFDEIIDSQPSVDIDALVKAAMLEKKN